MRLHGIHTPGNPGEKGTREGRAHSQSFQEHIPTSQEKQPSQPEPREAAAVRDPEAGRRKIQGPVRQKS